VTVYGPTVLVWRALCATVIASVASILVTWYVALADIARSEDETNVLVVQESLHISSSNKSTTHLHKQQWH
jgi:hypothetical protein